MTTVWGHSSVWDFDPSPVGDAFRPLVDGAGGGLQVGDDFTFVKNGVRMNYEVTNREYVKGDDINRLEELSASADALVFTCDFPDFAAGRWVFQGKLKE